jgi:hypothetical protein
MFTLSYSVAQVISIGVRNIWGKPLPSREYNIISLGLSCFFNKIARAFSGKRSRLFFCVL